VLTQRLQDGEGSTRSRAIRREDGSVPELRSDLLERIVALGFNDVGGLLDVDFSATAPGVPAGAVALHAHDTGGSARWLLAPAPLHGRPSLLLLLSNGAQEVEKKFPGGGGLRNRWLRMDFIGGG
jgi:hypothetical protein